MGVEVAESVVPQVIINGSSDDIGSFLQKAGNGKEIHGWQTVEPIMFGSHGAADETVVNGDAKDAGLPKDSVAEWPAPRQFHSFFFVKYRFYEDPKLKLKVEEGERRFQKLNQERFSILEKLRAKRGAKTALNIQIEPLSVENSKYRKMFDDKRKEMEPLQEALGKLRGSGMAGDRTGALCSSEEELNAVIKSFEYRISHDSITLTEEKQILREIKQLEGTRDRVIANSAIRAKLQESLGEKTVIQDQVKHMGGDLDVVKKEKKAIGNKISKLIEERNSINVEIKALELELEAATKKRDEELEKLQSLRKEKDVGNGSLNANRALLNDARNHAGKQDIEKLKELCETQVKSFISSWSNKKEFREDYERRILTSLDARQLSRDGRLRNPGEKPLIEASAPPPQVETAKKAIVRPPKEEVIISKTEAQPIVSVQKEEVKKSSKPQKEAKSKQTDLDAVLEPVVDSVVVKEKEIPEEIKIDEAKLKEIKREEEIAKSKQALERKKKQAEKAATKAAIKAQKDEEKKLKEREKKARKKAAASAPADESDEPAEAEVAEPEKAEEISEAPVSLKNKDVKDKTVRPRSRRPTKGTDSLPRAAILKRKQSTNYWVWALPAGITVLLLVLAIAYRYLL